MWYVSLSNITQNIAICYHRSKCQNVSENKINLKQTMKLHSNSCITHHNIHNHHVMQQHMKIKLHNPLCQQYKYANNHFSVKMHWKWLFQHHLQPQHTAKNKQYGNNYRTQTCDYYAHKTIWYYISDKYFKYILVFHCVNTQYLLWQFTVQAWNSSFCK
jgi:L-lactate utilization protein LutB